MYNYIFVYCMYNDSFIMLFLPPQKTHQNIYGEAQKFHVDFTQTKKTYYDVVGHT